MRPLRVKEDIRPLSEFRANAAAFVEKVRATRRPMVLTQHGKSAAVLLDVDEYDRLLERAGLLEDVADAEDQLRRDEGVDQSEVKGRVLRRRGL